jgi:hypothetical protein
MLERGERVVLSLEERDDVFLSPFQRFERDFLTAGRIEHAIYRADTSAAELSLDHVTPYLRWHFKSEGRGGGRRHNGSA